MNPAFSVIAFTLLAGCGQGLAAVLSLAILAGVTRPSDAFTGTALVSSALLMIAGLAASFLHLGRPSRAWRAAAMWRTSWLSREVIVLPACVGLLMAWWLAWRSGSAVQLQGLWFPLLTLAAVSLLWLCTGMIYVCIRFIQEWAHPLTSANFALIGLSSGAVLACVLTVAAGDTALLRTFAPWALAMTIVAGGTRMASLMRNARITPRSTLQSATGVNAKVLRQMTMGMTGGSFNTREFFHGASTRALRHVKLAAITLGFVAPAVLLAGGAVVAPSLCIAAAVLQAIGLVADRWFFFAQARHPQNLYYQRVS